MSSNAQLVMPKTDFNSKQLLQLITAKNLSDGNFFLGMAKVGGQWIWDDGSPVFVRRTHLEL